MRPISALLSILAAMVGLFLSVLTAAAQNYHIQPGDVLKIEVLEDPGLNRSVLVAPDGRISVPLAGAMAAAGQTVEGLQGTLADTIAGNFATRPTVLVSVEQVTPKAPATAATGKATITVYVMGEANNPGQLQLERGTSVLQAFASMGGFTPFAATQRIQLRREGADGVEKIYPLNYDAIEAGKSQAGRTTLSDGDVIVIPQRRLFE
jgi:polysaccharide export outer membrane protein